MRHRLSLVLVLLASCQSELTTSAPVVFDGQGWAGGTLKIASSAFNSPTLPIVLLGNDTLVVQRLDSITVQARVPDTSGTLSLSVAEFGRWTSLGAIVVHGFATSVPIAHIDQVYGSGALPWPESSATFIVRVNGQY